jgi:plastocyanin
VKPILSLASALVLAVGLAACSAASADAPSASAVSSADPNAVRVDAKGIAFQPPSGVAPAGTAFQIAFDNQDGAPHNISIVAANGTEVFDGAIVSGPARTVYAVPALAAGTYHLRCDVHPDMDAALTVR